MKVRSDRIRIPKYAKANAREARKERLQFSRDNRPILNDEEAEERGIASGYEVMVGLIDNQSMSIERAQRIEDTLTRFHGLLDGLQDNDERTKKTKIVIKGWGGSPQTKRFLEYIQRKLDDKL